jgi:hypothetical protein
MAAPSFSETEIAHFRARVHADPAAMTIVVVRLHEIAGTDRPSFRAARLAAEALRALGAQVPLTPSEEHRQKRARGEL